jgi:hypothetical protein
MSYTALPDFSANSIGYFAATYINPTIQTFNIPTGSGTSSSFNIIFG